MRSAIGRGMPDLPQIILPFPLETTSEEFVRQIGNQLTDPVAKGLLEIGQTVKEIS